MGLAFIPDGEEIAKKMKEELHNLEVLDKASFKENKTRPNHKKIKLLIGYIRAYEKDKV